MSEIMSVISLEFVLGPRTTRTSSDEERRGWMPLFIKYKGIC